MANTHTLHARLVLLASPRVFDFILCIESLRPAWSARPSLTMHQVHVVKYLVPIGSKAVGTKYHRADTLSRRCHAVSTQSPRSLSTVLALRVWLLIAGVTDGLIRKSSKHAVATRIILINVCSCQTIVIVSAKGAREKKKRRSSRVQMPAEMVR